VSSTLTGRAIFSGLFMQVNKQVRLKQFGTLAAQRSKSLSENPV
jgi:hypothetical protein